MVGGAGGNRGSDRLRRCGGRAGALAFFALTVNVYDVPLVSPVTVQESSPVVVQVLAPGEEVTV